MSYQRHKAQPLRAQQLGNHQKQRKARISSIANKSSEISISVYMPKTTNLTSLEENQCIVWPGAYPCITSVR